MRIVGTPGHGTAETIVPVVQRLSSVLILLQGFDPVANASGPLGVECERSRSERRIKAGAGAIPVALGGGGHAAAGTSDRLAGANGHRRKGHLSAGAAGDVRVLAGCGAADRLSGSHTVDGADDVGGGSRQPAEVR